MRAVFPRAVRVFIVGFVVLGGAWLVWRDQTVEQRAPDDGAKTTRTRSGLEASASRDAGAAGPGPRRHVNGRVRDEAGEPLVGATVRLFADAPIWLSDSAPKGCATSPLTCHTQAAASEVLKKHAEGTLAFPVPIATATSDADGGFHFDDAPADGFVFAWKGDRGTAEELQGTADVDLQLLEENLEHTTFLVESDGLGLPGATLTAINPFTGQSQRGVTDAQGQFKVTLSGWLVWVAAEKAGLQTAFRVPASREALLLTAKRSVRIGLGAAEGPKDGTVTLNCGGRDEQRQTKNAEVTFDDVPSTSCRVQARTPTHLSVVEHFVHPGGLVEKSVPLLPAAVLSLTLISGDDDGPVPDGRAVLSGEHSRSHALRAEAGERISFPPIPAGPFTLRVDVPGYVFHVVESTLPPGESHREVVLMRRVRVSGRVVSSEGGPVSGANLAVFTPGFMERADTIDGGFSLWVNGPGAFKLHAFHETEGVSESAFSVPGASPVVRLERRGVIAVEARTGAGALVTSDGTLEFLNPPDTHRFGTRWALHWSDEGTSRVAGLSPGTYRLRVEMSGWLPFERVISLAQDEQRREVVRLSAGERISGVVVDERGAPVGGAEVTIGEQGADTQNDGTFIVRGLALGAATVRVARDGRGTAERAITVPVSGLRLVLKEHPLRRGRVVDEARKPASAFVINGQDFRADDGRFEVRLARGGVLVVSAFGQVQDFRKLPDGDVGDLVVKRPNRLRGHVRHADGRNAVGVEIITPVVGRRRTDGNGNFDVEAVNDISVVAFDPDGYAIMALRADRLTEATLQPLLDVTGQVVDGEGNGTPARVEAKAQGVAGGSRAGSTTGPDGRFSLRVMPGVWVFEAEDGRTSMATIEHSGQFVKVAPGDGCSLVLLSRDDFGERLVTVSRGPERVAAIHLVQHARLVVPCGRYQVSAIAADGGIWATELELKTQHRAGEKLWVGAGPGEP